VDVSGRDETFAAREQRRAALCDPCAAEWLRWLDYRLPQPQRWIVKLGGNPNLLSLANREYLFRECRDTIRAQQKLIEDHCAASHVKAAVPGERPAVGPEASPPGLVPAGGWQPSLFEVA